ncbi:MAG: hypothetical protein HRU15_04285 [Planctomycetes bacterium]|nr:hypothetical protein [Planctomycetota bacterium]
MINIIFGLVIIFILNSCGGGGGAAPVVSDPAPVIVSSSITGTIKFTGGTANLTANITDNNAVSSVNIDITGPLGTSQVAATQSGNIWSAALSFPANENIFNQDAVYSVVIKAFDGNGNITSSSASTVTVSAMLRPPEPPSFTP